MAARNLTLTSIGLPVRAELRLKSMLEVVKNMTVDNWSYSQGGDADLAICEPNSALTALALKRKQSTGGTRCALLVKDDDAKTSSLPTIRDPVNPTEFLSLLNSISEQITDVVPEQSAGMADEHVSFVLTRSANSQVSSTAHDKENSVFALASALRTAAMDATGKSVILKVGSIELLFTPRMKVVLQSKELDAFDITELSDRGEPVAVREASAEEVAQWKSSNGSFIAIGALMWRLGIFGPRDRLISTVNPDSKFKLRRWPDFGRLEHTADHLRLAARLGRQFASVAEMTASIDQPAEKIRPFINACVLCDLMLVQAAVRSPAAAATATKTLAETESRYKGLFQSIRSALNFATS